MSGATRASCGEPMLPDTLPPVPTAGSSRGGSAGGSAGSGVPRCCEPGTDAGSEQERIELLKAGIVDAAARTLAQAQAGQDVSEEDLRDRLQCAEVAFEGLMRNQPCGP